MTDMDDALAQDNLMMLKVADQAQDLELQAADQIENMVGNSEYQHIRTGFVVFDYGGRRFGGNQRPGHHAENAGRDDAPGGRERRLDNALRKRTATFAGQLQNNHDERSSAQMKEESNARSNHSIGQAKRGMALSMRAGGSVVTPCWPLWPC